MKKNIDLIVKNPKKYAEEIATIKELEETLRYFSDVYYNTGTPVVSDEIFDLLKEILKQRDPKNKFLKEIGAPVAEKKKVKLPYPMGSLDKIKPDTEELTKWVKKYKGPYVLSDKLDGISAQLYKDKDGMMRLFSRGNGNEGQDITHLIRYTIGKNVKINDIPNETAIRGELIISKINFKKIEQKMANARNAVAGLVNSKKIDREVANITEFIAYSILNPPLKQIEQMEELKKWNFNIVTYKIEKKLSNELLNEYLIKRRKDSEYEIDGIVVVDSSKEYKVEYGNPDYAFAFKAVLDDQIAEAVVVDVLWDASMDGYLKPRIQIQPVQLVGTIVTYATAFNAKYVKDNLLGPGAVVKLVRSGDVIPHILEVIKPAKEPKMPDVPYKWTETSVDIIVKDIYGAFGDTIKTKRIVYFFKTLGVKYIDEGLVRKLVDNGYDSIPKILKVDKTKLENIEGIGKKMIKKIFDSIEESLKNTKLHIFMAGSHVFGRNLGEKKLKLIVDEYPNIMNEKWNKKELFEKINKIKGFSDITTNSFVDNFDKFKKFFDKINEIIDISYLKKVKVEKKTSELFKGEVIVFTGFRNKEWEKYIEENGGKISSSVSGNTTLVVYSADVGTSSKITKAKILKIKMMTEDEFRNKYIK